MTSFTFSADRPVEKYRKSDSVFAVCVLVLWGLGIFTLYTCTGNVGERFFDSRHYFVVRQLGSSILAFAGLVFFSVVPVNFLRRFISVITFASLGLCILALVPGFRDVRNGAARWISIPHVMIFQPSELVKFTIVLYLANMFDEHADEYKESNKEFIYPILVLILFVLVIFAQKDLSTGVFVFFAGLVMFFVTGASLKWIIPVAVLAVPAAFIMIFSQTYRIMRILAWFFPDEYALTAGFQNSASLRAISAGGLWGVGSGAGFDSVGGIPEVQSDYIFAGWACTMGLVGVTAYFLLLFLFSWRGFRISLNCSNRFAGYASFGCMVVIVVQSLLNCAVVAGVLPTTGVPLPFFSSGGSSLIVTMCMCGFVINASHCSADNENVGGGRTSRTEADDELEEYAGVVLEYE